MLTVTDPVTSKQGSSAGFTVNANTTSGKLVFSQDPPVWVKVATTFAAATTVYDAYSNTIPGHAVSVTLDPNPNGATATLTCPTSASPCVVNSDPDGISSFSLRVSRDSIGFKLSAAGSANANSRAFGVADVLNNCTTGQTCIGNGAADTPSTTQTNSSVSGAITGTQLALTTDSSLTLPATQCGVNASNPQVGSGMVFEVVNPSQPNQLGSPTWTITGYVLKSAQLIPSRGASKYDVCIGTTNIAGGTQSGCNLGGPPNPNTVSWQAKGGCATVAADGKYWGNVPDASSKVKSCSQATSPVVLSKSKTSGGGFPDGTLKIVFCAVFPWDGGGGFR